MASVHQFSSHALHRAIFPFFRDGCFYKSACDIFGLYAPCVVENDLRLTAAET
jgi:hypothetical protein